MPASIHIDPELAERAAKEWGNAHGYYGAAGGWISPGASQEAVTAGQGGRAVVQGWFNFWTEHKRAILDHYAAQLTAHPTFEAFVGGPSRTYRPTLRCRGPRDWRYAFLADAFDEVMASRRDPRRAYRGVDAPDYRIVPTRNRFVVLDRYGRPVPGGWCLSSDEAWRVIAHRRRMDAAG